MKELSPYDDDWLYIRAGKIIYPSLILLAAIARMVYLKHNVGMNYLKHHFGGKWRRGVRTPRHRASSRGIIRYCLQQLEEAGILKKDSNSYMRANSRRVSREG